MVNLHECYVAKLGFELATFGSATSWLVELEFNGPVNTIEVMWSRSGYLTTLFLGRITKP